MNRLFNAEGGQADVRGKALSKKGKQQQGKKRQGITTSPLPGTTLSFVKLNIGNGVALYDTPGLILPHQLTSKLSSDDLKVVIPQRKVDVVTLRVGEGKTVLLGGVARVEFLEGRPFFLTFFVANGVKIHATNSDQDMDAFVAKHAGELLTPPASPDALETMGTLVPHDIDIFGYGWKEAGCDIVLSGLGWVSVTGAGDCRVRVWAPQGTMVLQRDALMPFEARETLGKATGGRIVTGKEKSKGKGKANAGRGGRGGGRGGGGRGGGGRGGGGGRR